MDEAFRLDVASGQSRLRAAVAWPDGMSRPTEPAPDKQS